jgi:hypothetical protein
VVAASYDAAMIRVFADEGGYTNDPVDLAARPRSSNEADQGKDNVSR